MSRDYPARPSRRQGRGERYAEGRRRSDGGRGGQKGEQKQRLFIAAEIPAEAIEGLVSWQMRYLLRERTLRLTPPEQLHVTLVFLGQLGEHERDLAIGQLDSLSDRSQFTVTANAIVGLPRGRGPRVIAAELEEPAGRLKAIYEELAGGLEEKKVYKREKRPFFPHVTIARVRGRIKLETGEIQPEPVKFTAVRITLYNSILKPGGAVHQPLKTVQLN